MIICRRLQLNLDLTNNRHRQRQMQEKTTKTNLLQASSDRGRLTKMVTVGQTSPSETFRTERQWQSSTSSGARTTSPESRFITNRVWWRTGLRLERSSTNARTAHDFVFSLPSTSSAISRVNGHRCLWCSHNGSLVDRLLDIVWPGGKNVQPTEPACGWTGHICKLGKWYVRNICQ